MNECITKIDKDTYLKSYTNFKEVSNLDSESDIATFIDTFEKSGLNAPNILKVLEKDGKYIFVYDDNESSFDFFVELNKISSLDYVNITSQNAKLLFRKEKSRGYYIKDDSVLEVSTGETDNTDDEAPTGFMDDDDLTELQGVQKTLGVLLHIKNGERLPIDSHGITLGRSYAQADYAIGNSKVSRKHASVYQVGDKYMVHDYGSANGTFIDGLRVRQEHDREILKGSILLLADEKFQLL